jgi:hypothetical protein
MKRVYDRHRRKLDEFRIDARFIPLRAAATHRAIIRTVRNWDAEANPARRSFDYSTNAAASGGITIPTCHCAMARN